MGRLNSLVDTFLILMCICVAAFAGNQVFNTSYIPPIMGGERITLGQVFELQNDVRRRSFDNFSWHNLGSNEALFHNDRIFTDKDSTAQLEFSSGNRIKVSEESLFKITQETDGINLNIEQGIIFATLNNANEAFVVKVGDQVYEITSNDSKIKISNSSGNKELSVLDGKASVRLGDREETIEKGVRVLLTDESYTVKQSWPSEFSPVDGDVFYVNEKNLIKFNFNEKVGKLFLSKSRSAFENGEAHEVNGLTVELENLPEGIFYWQVNDESNISTEKSFEIVYEVMPEFENLDETQNTILVDNEKIIYTQAFDDIELMVNGKVWNDYEYDDGELRFTFEEVGDYEISYRNKAKVRPHALFSKPSLIKVVAKPEEIVLKRPFNGEEYYFYNDDVIKFSWETQDLFSEVSTYLVLNGKRQLVAGNSFSTPVTESGEYLWSLEYVLNNEVIARSKENKYRVTFDDDNSALESGRKIVVKKPGDVIDLTWQQQGSDKFVVEVSRERNFKSIKESIKTTGSNTKLLIKELGVHYWRVKNEENKFVPPVKIIIVPPPPPKAPRIDKVEKRVQVLKKSIPLAILDMLIDQAFAKDSVELKWEPVSDVKEYRIQILDGEKVIVDEKVKLNHFEWNDYLTGHFQWRVSAIDFWNQESPFSPLEDLIITKKFGGAKGIDLVTPKHGINIDEGDVVEMKFNQVRGDEFFIEISMDKYFTSIKEIPLGKKTTYKFRNKLGTSFYWRVKAIEKKDIIYSKKRRVDVSRKEVVRPKKNGSVTISKKTMNKKKWYFGYAPEKISYEVISSGKKIVVDDMNFISFYGGLKEKIDNYQYLVELKQSTGVVFNDLGFNQTLLKAKALKEYHQFQYGLTSLLEYRSELDYNGSEVTSNAQFYFNLGLSSKLQYENINFYVDYFFLNYAGLSTQLSYTIKRNYEVGISLETRSHSKIEAEASNIALRIQYNY
ncbi:sigma factor regulatory protein, FecR/PupR family [Bacteriovorax sp. BAL6_X]|nr:sigma factor regulatory protein, FecR/PupR family [Bacteriovorax sp. BAL6_X]